MNQAIVLTFLSLALPAQAAEPAIPVGGQPALEASVGWQMTPDSAVRTALSLDPEVALALAVVEERRGIVKAEEGRFDPRVLATGNFAFDARELIGAKLEQERNRRLQLDLVSRALEETATGISEGLGGIGTPRADLLLQQQCEDTANTVIIRTDDGRQTIICRDALGNVVDVVLVGNSEVIRMRDLLKLFNDPLRGNLGENLELEFRRQLILVATVIRATSITLREQFERLGITPDVIEQLSLDLQVSQQLRFRNGSSVTTSLFLNSTEENFEGKPRDPAYGDSLVPNTFTSAAGFSYVVPLGRGGGVVSAGAPEAAAREQLAAALELLAHESALAAAGALDAYWEAAASQERQQVFVASEALLDRIVGETQRLVDADQLARVEVDRAAARRAETRRQLALANQEFREREAELVRQIGLSAMQLEGRTLELGGLPRLVRENVSADEWIARALARRHDLLASERSVKAAEILARAAKADLRQRVDFSLNASYNALHESYEDRLYDFSGFKEAWDGRIAGPSYGFKLHWFLPVGNREARGRSEQAEAALAQSEVGTDDLRRTIRIRLRSLEIAEAAQRSVVDAGFDLLENRQQSLLDSLVTESRLTALRLELVGARLELLRLDTRLRFESGMLLEGGFAADDGKPDPTRLRLALATESE